MRREDTPDEHDASVAEAPPENSLLPERQTRRPVCLVDRSPLAQLDCQLRPDDLQRLLGGQQIDEEVVVAEIVRPARQRDGPQELRSLIVVGHWFQDRARKPNSSSEAIVRERLPVVHVARSSLFHRDTSPRSSETGASETVSRNTELTHVVGQLREAADQSLPAPRRAATALGPPRPCRGCRCHPVLTLSPNDSAREGAMPREDIDDAEKVLLRIAPTP